MTVGDDFATTQTVFDYEIENFWDSNQNKGTYTGQNLSDCDPGYCTCTIESEQS